SPQGHSYPAPGHHAPPVVWRPPEQWRACDDYLYGCDLYNHGYWWEAHEAWEGLWRVCPKGSVQKRFLQGLIQVSACHLKVRLGSREGVERLRDSSNKHFDAAFAAVGEGRLMGLDPGAFLLRVNQYHARMFSDRGPMMHDWPRFPYVELD